MPCRNRPSGQTTPSSSRNATLAVAVSEMRPSVDVRSASSNPLRRASRE